MTKPTKGKTSSRRSFLKVAAAGAAATVAAPNIASAQGPISMRWQSTWPSKDIFHEYALDYAKKVNDMTGGDLKIEVLPAGAVVPAFGLLDAVSKGVLDGGHGVLVYHYGKQTALALWGSGPGFAMDANMLLAWHKYGGGKELLEKLYASIGANVVSFPYGPMPTQPLGWFKKPVDQGGGPQGHQVPHRRHLDRRVHRHGRRRQRAAGRRNRLGDGPRPARCGRVQQRLVRPHPRLPRRFQGLHAAELSPERRAVRDHVQQGQVQRAAGEDEGDHRQCGGRGLGQDMSWKAIDRYSKDYAEMQTKDNVKFYKTPDAILKQQLEIYDEVVEEEVGGKPAVQGNRRSRRSRSPSGRRSGSRTRW